jgi:hypothetical protein
VDRAAECYSWARTADQLIAVYRRLANVQEPAEVAAEETAEATAEVVNAG